MEKYVCTVCGYIYDPAEGDMGNLAPGTPWEQVPEEWTCPVCGAVHDRDVNAAKNILNEGLRLLASYIR